MGSAFLQFAAGQCTDKTFLGLVPWYHYLNLNSSCDVTNFNLLGTHSGVLLILLAVVDDLLRIAGIVAVAFVIYGGIRYITSQGSPDETGKAQSTIMNALIGLAIAIIAVGVVSFIGNKFAASAPGAYSGSGVDVSSLPHTQGVASGGVLKTVLGITFGVVGALSLLFMVIGGFRYIVSQGDPQAVSKAKDTLMYAVIGLAIALIAESIVTFVVGRI